MNSDVHLITSLISLVLVFCIFGIPMMQVLKRTGFSRAWVLMIFVPLLNIVFFWIFAFKDWPNLPRN